MPAPMPLLRRQLAICARFQVGHFATPPSLTVAIAKDALDGVQPLHALRYEPEGGASGWFIWGGDKPSQAEDYFTPCTPPT
jgi:hypothetical protein